MALFGGSTSTGRRAALGGVLAVAATATKSRPSGALVSLPTLAASTSNAVATWSPADAGNIVLWIDPADASTLTMDGAGVARVADKSGGNRHVSQPDIARQMTTTTINGLTALVGTGSQFLVGAAPNVSVDDISVYAVFRQDAEARVNQGIVSFGPSGGSDWNSARGFSLNTSNADHCLEMNAATSSTAGRGRILGRGPSSLNVWGGIKNGNRGPLVYSSGKVGTFSTPPPASSWGIADGGITIGTRWLSGVPATAEPLTGVLCEVVVFADAHSAETREKMEGYLAHRWGLTADLPSYHPYKTFPPTKEPSSTQVTRSWQGAATATGFTTSVEFNTKGVTARLRVSTQADLSNASFGPQATTRGVWLKLTSPPLSPATTYHSCVEISDGAGGWVVDDRRNRITTFPAAGTAAPVTIAAASCSRTVESVAPSASAFSRIAARQPDVMCHLGDFGYWDYLSNNVDLFRHGFRDVLANPTQRDLYAKVPVAHMWDDHDFGPNGSSSWSASKRAALAAYREIEPHYPLALQGSRDPVDHAFWLGRVLIVMLDTRSNRIPGSSKLSSGQMAWLLSIINGTATVQGLSADTASLTVINVGTPWIAASGSDTWNEAPAQRTSICDAIAAAGKIDSTLIIHGDAHSFGLDDGTNNTYATDGRPGCRVACLGPLDQKNSTKGGPYSIGLWVERQQQYGMIDIADTGTHVTVRVTGYRADTDAILGSGAATMTWTSVSGDASMPVPAG